MSDFDNLPKKKKVLRKITPQRLKNIALYYLKRFETSVENLRSVLRRRVDEYARAFADFNKAEAYGQIEALLAEFEKCGYIDDSRYARLKIQSYLSAGKPARYIRLKLRQKGIDTPTIDALLSESEYDPLEMARQFARRKKIGPFRPDSQARAENRQKDLGAIVRAGFDYETALCLLSETNED